jgi:hypothetical protein
MATYNLVKTFLVLGSIPFLVLGIIHIVLMILERRKPGALSPDDKHVRIAMNYTRLRITNKTTMWKAWIGFNISHGAGVIIFGSLPLIMAVFHFDDFLHYQLLLPLFILVSLCYFWLAITYWFKIPAILIGMGSGFLGIAWVILLATPVNIP